jgi:hypothetical protein
MGGSSFRRKIRAAVKFLTTTPEPLDPTKKYPVKVRYAVLMAIGVVFLEWYYLFVQVSYDTIPSKWLFWLSFLGWSMPGIIVEWAYRNLPTKRLLDKYANWWIGIGVAAITVGIMSTRTNAILPVAYALIPGFMAGALVGSNSLLVWRLIKTRHAQSKPAA